MSADKLEPLSPSVEALLDSVRTVDSAPEELRRRALARARASASVIALAPRLKPSFGSLGLKLAAAFVVAAALGSAAVLRFRATHKPAPAALAASAPPLEAPSAALAEAAPTTEAATPSETADDRASPQPLPAAPAHTARERYALELKVLEPARAAVARADFSAALASIAEHQRRFPDGQLSEEREALRVQALSGLGRTEEATRAASAFRKRFPGSVLISRMQALRQAP